MCCTVAVKVCEIEDSKLPLGEGSKLVLRIGYCYTRIGTAYGGAASSSRHTTIYNVDGGGCTGMYELEGTASGGDLISLTK